MPTYSGGERLFTFEGKTRRGYPITTSVAASSYKDAVASLGRWGIHSATLQKTRYLEGVERKSIALFETSEDPFLGPKWTVAIDGISRAVSFGLGHQRLDIRFLKAPNQASQVAKPTLRVVARRTGGARLSIGHPSIIAPSDGTNAKLLMDTGWTWSHEAHSEGFVINLEPGWNLPHALHLGIRGLMLCGVVDDDSYLQVLGECVRVRTVIGWWTDTVEYRNHTLYRIPREWPPPPRHPNKQKPAQTSEVTKKAASNLATTGLPPGEAED